MRTLFCFFVFGCFTFTLNGQLQVTHQKRDNTVTQNYIHSFNGQNYLLQVTQGNQIGISKIVDDGLQKMGEVRLTSGGFSNIFVNSGAIHISTIYAETYNIESEKSYGSFNFDHFGLFSEWVSHSDAGVLVKGKDYNNSGRFYYTFQRTNATNKLLSNSLDYSFVVNNDFLVAKSEKQSEKGVFNYYVFSVNGDKIITTLINNSSKKELFSYYEDKLYFFDETDQLVEYNTSSKTREYYDIYANPNSVSRKAIVQDDQIIVIEGNESSINITSYNKQTQIKEYQWEQTGYGIVNKSENVVALDSLTIGMRTMKNHYNVLHLDQKSMEVLPSSPSYSSIKFPANDKYVVTIQDKSIYLYNLADRTLHNTDMIETFLPINNTEVVEINGKTYISLYFSNAAQTSLYQIEGNGDIVEAYDFDLSSKGFFIGTELVSTAFGTYVDFDDIHRIKNTYSEIIGTDALTIPYNYIFIDTNAIYYAKYTNDVLTIYKDDGNATSQVLAAKDFPGIVRSFAVRGNMILIQDGSQSQIWVFDINDGQLIDIIPSALEANLYGFTVQEAYVFYNSSAGHFMINSKNQQFKIDDIIGSTVKYRHLAWGEVFYATDDGYYKFQAGEFIRLSYSQSIYPIQGVDRLKLFASDQRIFYLENNTLSEIGENIDYSYYLTECISLDFMVFSTFKDQKYIIDGASKQMYDFPSALKGYKPIDLIKIKDDTILIASSSEQIYVFKLFDGFQQYILKDSYIQKSENFTGNAVSLGDAGILQSSVGIFTIDEKGILTKLDRISGVYPYSDFAQNAQYTYFFGYSAEEGKQVYAVENRLINATDDINNYNFKLHPNPTFDYIKISNKIPQLTRFDVIDQNGQQLLFGVLNIERLIKVSTLNSGHYFVRFFMDDEIISKPFIKL